MSYTFEKTAFLRAPILFSHPVECFSINLDRFKSGSLASFKIDHIILEGSKSFTNRWKLFRKGRALKLLISLTSVLPIYDQTCMLLKERVGLFFESMTLLRGLPVMNQEMAQWRGRNLEIGACTGSFAAGRMTKIYSFLPFRSRSLKDYGMLEEWSKLFQSSVSTFWPPTRTWKSLSVCS